MTKLAAIKTTKPEEVRIAKRAFFMSLFDLSWRLAATMLGPLFVGLFIDSRISGEGQTFALIGFGLGMVLGALTLRHVVLGMKVEDDK
jgi:hypothetical protein